VLKSWQPDKHGASYTIKLPDGSVKSITPSYLEDDKTVDYSKMTDEELKTEIKASRSFDDEYEI
jgi:hypothetical protein